MDLGGKWLAASRSQFLVFQNLLSVHPQTRKAHSQHMGPTHARHKVGTQHCHISVFLIPSHPRSWCPQHKDLLQLLYPKILYCQFWDHSMIPQTCCRMLLCVKGFCLLTTSYLTLFLTPLPQNIRAFWL